MGMCFMVKERLPCQPTNSPPSPGDRNRCITWGISWNWLHACATFFVVVVVVVILQYWKLINYWLICKVISFKKKGGRSCNIENVFLPCRVGSILFGIMGWPGGYNNITIVVNKHLIFFNFTNPIEIATDLGHPHSWSGSSWIPRSWSHKWLWR